MAVPYSERQMAATLAASRPFNRVLTGLCVALLAGLAAIYMLILASVPAFYDLAIQARLAPQYVADNVFFSQDMLAAGAANRGMSLTTFVLYDLVLHGLFALGFWFAAGLVAWRAKQDWFRWFTALILAFFPSGDFLWQILAAVHPTAAAYLDIIALLWPGFFLFLFLFPDGRAAPRWARWPLAGILLVHLFIQLIGYLTSLPGTPVTPPPGFEALFVVIPLGFAFVLGCQIYRYARVADAAMRKQIQWFVAALLLIVLGTAIEAALGGDVIGNNSSDHGFSTDLDYLTTLVVPAAITIAILRYRLWDIDVLIRRTLIYAVLTGLLALAYFGSVVVLQNLFGALTGQSQSALVTVLSTLVIAALFGPLRVRVQAAIDRRFYRRKYDAARILADFGASAREDVNLDDLTGRLVSVVDETVKPSSVAVWLARPAQRER
jgi:hypothetical protein